MCLGICTHVNVLVEAPGSFWESSSIALLPYSLKQGLLHIWLVLLASWLSVSLLKLELEVSHHTQLALMRVSGVFMVRQQVFNLHSVSHSV